MGENNDYLIIGAVLHILCYDAIAWIYGISNEIIFYSYKTYQNEYQSLPLLMLVWNHSVATQATNQTLHDTPMWHCLSY